jgi:8-oxo-dGTP diphosphatase
MDTQLVGDDLFWCGVKIVLKNFDNQILLLKGERKEKSFWELPGGRIKIGESELDALHREMAEETGITAIDNVQPMTMNISKHRFFVSDDQPVGLIFSIFSGSVRSDVVTLSDDHSDYAWVTPEQAAQLVGDAYGKIFEKV